MNISSSVALGNCVEDGLVEPALVGAEVNDESVTVVALGNFVKDALVERTLVGAEVDDETVTVVAGTGVEVLTVGTVAVDASVEV